MLENGDPGQDARYTEVLDDGYGIPVNQGVMISGRNRNINRGFDHRIWCTKEGRIDAV